MPLIETCTRPSESGNSPASFSEAVAVRKARSSPKIETIDSGATKLSGGGDKAGGVDNAPGVHDWGLLAGRLFRGRRRGENQRGEQAERSPEHAVAWSVYPITNACLPIDDPGPAVAALFASAQTPSHWKIHDMERTRPRLVTATPSLLQPAPSDAIVLFDGKDISQWVSPSGGPPAWVVRDGYMESVRGSGGLRTKRSFGDVQLHVEFALPTPPQGVGQGRGNSGVFLMGKYEIQVLDSWKNHTYADGQAGAIYGQSPPLVNAARPPGDWQAFDVVFRRPRFRPDGSLRTPARLTVFHNGVLVQDNHEAWGPTRWLQYFDYDAHPDRLPLSLQDHANPVRFRNILGARARRGYAPWTSGATGSRGHAFHGGEVGALRGPLRRHRRQYDRFRAATRERPDLLAVERQATRRGDALGDRILAALGGCDDGLHTGRRRQSRSHGLLDRTQSVPDGQAPVIFQDAGAATRLSSRGLTGAGLVRAGGRQQRRARRHSVVHESLPNDSSGPANPRLMLPFSGVSIHHPSRRWS